MDTYSLPARFFMWAANGVWSVAHRLGRVDVGDEYWVSNAIYYLAMLCEAVWGEGE